MDHPHPTVPHQVDIKEKAVPVQKDRAPKKEAGSLKEVSLSVNPKADGSKRREALRFILST
jgi:hypothetical protein